VSDAHEKARLILIEYREKLDAIAKRLLEVETITRAEFEEIFPPPYPKTSGTPELMILRPAGLRN
jgi:cell division protease FtsH